MMHLLIGKLPLLGYRDGDLAVRHPAAQAFALLAEKTAGGPGRVPRHRDGPPSLYAFEVDRPAAGRCSSSGITVTRSTAKTSRPPT
jgi:hypothetical protein